MKEIIIGIVSGIVSGTGMGGGTILIFLLTFMCGIEQHIAQATNLIFFIPTAITSVIIGIKNKNINVKEALVIVVSGIVGAIISANISSNLNVNLLRKMFGAFLLIIAIYEIYSWFNMYIKKQKGHNKAR